MSLDITTQSEVGAINPENGAENLPLNEGIDIGNAIPQAEPEKVVEERKYSQKELDNVAAKARGTAERETQKRIMQQLGLNSYDEDTLLAMKEAYENSLTDAELRDQEYNDLSDENLNLLVELDEKNYMIEALTAMSGKKSDDVKKIVKMAQGLKTEDNSIADCIKEVMELINPSQAQPKAGNVSSMPVGQPLNQPSAAVTIDAATNPFKPGASYNLTAQGRLWKENPELARRLAGEAGIKLNF